MNTGSSIPEFVQDAIDYGNQLIAAREYAARADEERLLADEVAKFVESWQPVLTTIQQATPEWAHAYIVTPSDRGPDLYDGYYMLNVPAVIALSALLADVPAIRVWAHPHDQNPSILFEAGRYSLVYDDEAGAWYVATRFDNYKVHDNNLRYFQPGSENATDDFHVALAQAVADRTDLAALQADADRLNARPAGPVEAVDPVPPAPVDPLERIADALERLTASYENSRPF